MDSVKLDSTRRATFHVGADPCVCLDTLPMMWADTRVCPYNQNYAIMECIDHLPAKR